MVLEMLESAIDNYTHSLNTLSFTEIIHERSQPDFKTIDIQMPRRSGHTHAAVHITNKFKDPMIVVNSERTRSMMLKDYAHVLHPRNICTLNEVGMQCRGRNIDALIFDNASSLDRMTIDKVVYEVSLGSKPFVILLG